MAAKTELATAQIAKDFTSECIERGMIKMNAEGQLVAVSEEERQGF